MPRHLFGPVTREFGERFLRDARASGECLTFGPDADIPTTLTDSWADIAARLPAGWEPEFVAVMLAYSLPPTGVWDAPVPIVGLAGDWNLLWHGYRRIAGRCDLLLTDAGGVETFRRAGFGHVNQWCLYGLPHDFLPDTAVPASERDIDVLFVGNMNPAVQGERLPWLTRLAALSDRFKVVVTTNVHGQDYMALMRRAKVAFNRSIRGEANQRAFEAVAAGAVLFQEAENGELPTYLTPDVEYVTYRDGDLEGLLERYLGDAEKRERMTTAATAKVGWFTFDHLWREAVDRIAIELSALRSRASARPSWAPSERAIAEAYLSLSAVDGRAVLTAMRTLEAYANAESAAECRAVQALTARRQLGLPGVPNEVILADTVRRFEGALQADPRHVVARMGLVEGLADGGQPVRAAEEARRVLAELDGECHGLDGFLFAVVKYDRFRATWEQAGREAAGNSVRERDEKKRLLAWQAHSLLAEITSDLNHYQAAAELNPTDPTTRAALGCALARGGRFDEAVAHLEAAVAANPLDLAAARALFQVHADRGDRAAAERAADLRRRWHRAAPSLVPAELWFPEAAPTRRMRVALTMIVRNEEHNLPDCLAGCRDLFDDVVVVDTGSTDRTREVAAALGARVVEFPWVDSFADARNVALDHARADFAFWLDADDRLDPANRDRLAALFAGLTDEHAAYVVKCRCVPAKAGEPTTVVDHVRLFRLRPDVRWAYRVHEQILPALRRTGADVRWSGVSVDHVGYVDPALRRRKLDRDLRLLRMEAEAGPDEPFVLFNLGSVYQELGQPDLALPALERSLARSHPRDSIVRKLYALIAQCHRRTGRTDDALRTVIDGRTHYPDDAELLFLEGVLRAELRDWDGAERAYLRLIHGRDGEHFASVDDGLRGVKARHNLAGVYHDAGRLSDAAEQYRAALDHDPSFVPALIGLGELCRATGDGVELSRVTDRLRAAGGEAEVAAACLQAQWWIDRGQLDAARAELGPALDRHPRAVGLWVLLSHTWLKHGPGPAAEEQAEAALRSVLALTPDHPEATHNLRVLLGGRHDMHGVRV